MAAAASMLALFFWQAVVQPPSPLQSALALFNAGKYKECFDVISPYVQSHPDSAEAHKVLGMDEYMLGNADGALADVTHATELNSNDADAFYYLGRLYFSADNPLSALTAFQKAIELDPSSVRAHNQLGQTYEALSRSQDAEREYRQAISLEEKQPKKSPWPYYNLGLLCLEAGRTQEAISYLHQALDRNPTFGAAQVKLAVALTKQNHSDEAFQLLQTAIREDPRNAEAHYHLGQLLSRLGRKQEADQEFALFQKCRGH